MPIWTQATGGECHATGVNSGHFLRELKNFGRLIILPGLIFLRIVIELA